MKQQTTDRKHVFAMFDKMVNSANVPFVNEEEEETKK